jgi:hypothetical protein
MAGAGAQPDIQGPYGPANEAYTVTAPNGTGQADIAVETKKLNSMLGCDQSHPCSLAIVPGQGGDALTKPPTCANHTLDSALAVPNYTFSSTYGSCSWADRIIVPLQFSPAVTGCPLASPAFTADGSPVLARAMQQWLTGLCAGAHGLGVLYNGEIGEPQSMIATYNGLADIALTTRPASADSADGVHPTGSKTYVYAPLAITAGSVAYWMDNPATGQPYANLKLNQRLLTKLLTTSYNFSGDGCVPVVTRPPGLGCDAGVNNNPGTLYADPEFTKLNPGVQPPLSGGAQFQVPTVQSGNFDLTWTVTRWIGADATAAAFIKGTADPWNMHINTSYKGMAYPTDSFLSQDPYPVIQHKYSPVFPPERVAQYQAQNWDPGTSWEKDVTGNYPKDSPQAPGARSLISVMSNGDAAAYTFPVMAIPNAAGKYVQPTTASMTAAAQHLVSIGSGVQQASLTNTDPNAYPLTTIVYAMVPTSGISHTKAAAIARFLDSVAGSGQQSGTAPGQLAVGYAPLPASMRAQTQKIATEVANQSGGTPGGNGNGRGNGGNGSGPIGTGTGSGSGATPGGSSGLSPSPGRTLGHNAGKTSASLPGAHGPGITTLAVAHPQTAAFTRFALPAVLIAGGLAGLGGSSALAGSGGVVGRVRRTVGRIPHRWGPGIAGTVIGRKP